MHYLQTHLAQTFLPSCHSPTHSFSPQDPVLPRPWSWHGLLACLTLCKRKLKPERYTNLTSEQARGKVRPRARSPDSVLVLYPWHVSDFSECFQGFVFISNLTSLPFLSLLLIMNHPLQTDPFPKCPVKVWLTLFYLLDVFPFFPLSFPDYGVCACWSLYLTQMPPFSDLLCISVINTYSLQSTLFGGRCLWVAVLSFQEDYTFPDDT